MSDVAKLYLQQMKRIIFIVFLSIFALSFSNNATAQLPANMRITAADQISDDMLRAYLEYANKRGFTQEQIEADFTKRGLTSFEEMGKLRARIQVLQPQSANAATVQDTSARTAAIQVTENGVQTILTTGTQDTLLLYGTELFNNSELSFTPSMQLATPLNYKLGPGDQLQIDVSGINDSKQSTTVTSEGVIRLNYVGPIAVSGLTIEEATAKIKSRLTSIYPALRSGGTKLVISLGSIRSIKVVVIGAAVKPGTYTLPSVATVFEALYACGGPNANGSFRNIELVRNGKLIQKMDAYDILVKGDQSSFVRLNDMDVIRIPFTESRITIQGQVKQPGVYEMRPTETLEDLIEYAGGYTDNAYTAMLKLERLTDKEKKIIDISKDIIPSFITKSGDNYTIGALLNRFENRVDIKGAVFRPGSYAFTPGMRITDLMAKAEGFKEEAYAEQALLYRLRDDRTKEILSVDLRNLTENSTNNILLKKDDELVVSDIFELRDDYTVSISGAVRVPGEIGFRENMSLKDLILISGGLQEDVYTGRAIVTRMKADRSFETINIDFENLLSDPQTDFKLLRNDDVFISPQSVLNDKATVSIFGEVHNPGTFTYGDSVTLKSLVLYAGGFTEFAELTNIEIARRRNDVDPMNSNSKLSDIIRISLDTTNLDFGSVDYILQRNDVVSIKRNPFMQSLRTVKVKGEVLYQGSYTLESRITRLSDLVKKAGGALPEANLYGARLTRTRSPNTLYASESIKRINQLVKDTSSAYVSVSDRESDDIVIDLKEAMENPGGRADILVEPNDVLFIPKFESMVIVDGEVLKPVKVSYRNGKGLRYYISSAAGFIKSADKGRTFVIYPNGRASRTKKILGLFRSYPKITPGTQVFVPKDIPKEKDVTASLTRLVAVLTGLATATSLTLGTIALINK